MKKICKAVLCVVVILLLGIFSQEETRAGVPTKAGFYFSGILFSRERSIIKYMPFISQEKTDLKNIFL